MAGSDDELYVRWSRGPEADLSDAGLRRGAAKLDDVDPQAWLADVLGRIAATPLPRLGELLPWNWVRQGGSWVTAA